MATVTVLRGSAPCPDPLPFSPVERAPTLSLASVRERRLAQAHAEHLRARIAYLRDRAKQALKLARIAALSGNVALVEGLLDEACTFRAMANGLADQQINLAQEIAR